MDLKTLRDDSRLHVGFTLFLIWLLAIWHFWLDQNLMRIIFYPLLSIAIIALFDFGLTYFRYRKNLGPHPALRERTASFAYLPTAAVVSGFLIGLILAPSEPFYVIVAASILTSLSKQFIAVGIRQHIFNPAAFGIMGVSLIFGTTVAWWGVSWGWYPLVIFVPLMMRILWRLHRLYLPLGFLLVYFIYLILTSSVDLALRTLVDSTVLLFALVMLPEPITSPAAGYFKYLFGASVAFVVIFVTTFTKISEAFLPALLLANLVSFSIVRVMARAKKVQ